MKTKRQKANDILEKLSDLGVSDSMILDFIINDHLSGDEAYDALKAAEQDLFDHEEDFESDKKHGDFEEEE